MKMNKLGLVLVAFLAVTVRGEALDSQVRTPFHLQKGKVAIWLIVPDWTVRKPKLLLVSGRLWHHADRNTGIRVWMEAMGGGLANRKGGIDPILNLRAGSTNVRADLYMEVFHNFGTRRTTLVFAVQKPVWRKIRLGVEMEPVFGKGKPDFGIGPKFTAPFRCGPLKCGIALTYFLKKKTDLARMYVPVYSADW
jgi:hypothetical protein